MDILIFDQDKYSETMNSLDKPIFYVDRIIFTTNDKDWVNRLFTASLTFKIAAYDEKNRELKSYQIPMTFGQFITPQHRQPVLEVNRLVTFREQFGFHQDHKCDHWTAAIELNNLTLQDDETLNIYLLDTEHVKEKYKRYENRVKDWKERISNLYSTIQNWLRDYPEFNLAIGQPMQMYEELMETYGIPPEQIDTAHLYRNNRLILSFKPKGLWIIGANGRLDILSPKGSFILVDKAEQFNPPQWHLYTAQDKRKGVPFNQQTFLNILSNRQS
jgi:hypothetical protein